jgi:hypothetical protein
MARTTNPSRTIIGSSPIRSARPPATPPITLLPALRENRAGRWVRSGSGPMA